MGQKQQTEISGAITVGIDSDLMVSFGTEIIDKRYGIISRQKVALTAEQAAKLVKDINRTIDDLSKTKIYTTEKTQVKNYEWENPIKDKELRTILNHIINVRMLDIVSYKISEVDAHRKLLDCEFLIEHNDCSREWFERYDLTFPKGYEFLNQAELTEEALIKYPVRINSYKHVDK